MGLGGFKFYQVARYDTFSFYACSLLTPFSLSLLDTLNMWGLLLYWKTQRQGEESKQSYKLEKMSEVEELIVKALGIKDIHYNRQNLAV